MRTHFLIPALALGFALITGSLLWAQAGTPPNGNGPHGTMRNPRSMMMDPLVSDMTALLKLTPAQAKQIKSIQDSTQKTMRAHTEKIIAKHKAVAAAMKADKPNLTTINKLITESGQEQIALRKAAAAGIVKIKGLLSKTQRAKLPDSPMFSTRFGMGGPGTHGRMPRGEQPSGTK
ncbi:MAG: Spy/CpxP family protein refolding chaperone [Armatimonadota bacterium]